ncbi:MAG: VCBS repeat-containing protein, partial [Gemmataceae bacterium]|nr:VCBS repeat-containing protein [Gemmataceae bacterium]
MATTRSGIWLRLGVATALALLGGVAVVAFCLVNPSPPQAHVPLPPHSDTPSPGAPWFVDDIAVSGIGFRHFDPATDQHNILETMGSGLAWIDYDNDGWLDLFCVQDGPLRPPTSTLPPGGQGGGAPTNKLYRNLGDGTFTDVTEAVGLARAGFGMGCAVGDYDNDGFD